jgi:hypothetical protein
MLPPLTTNKASVASGTPWFRRSAAGDAAPPWDYNPSSWRQRLPICGLAAVTGCIAAYLAAYQWRFVPTVWDPVFGEQTARVLDSNVSEHMRQWMLIPDAALGAIGYFSEAILGLAGSTRRWRERPWLVILFGIDVIPLGIVSAILVVLQGTVVGSWCFLCLVTAGVSLALVFLAYDEVWSSLVYLRDLHRRTHSREAVWNAFWGRTPEPASAVPPTDVPAATPLDYWPRFFEIGLGLWIAAAACLLPGSHDPQWMLAGVVAGVAGIASSALSLLRPCNKLHLANLVIAPALVGYLLLAASYPAGALVQNQLLAALLLINFAVIPNYVTKP